MQAHTDDHAAVMVTAPKDFVDAAARETVQTIRNAVDRGGRKIVADFSATTFMDSTAIGSLVGLAKECKEKEVLLRLRNLGGEIRELFIETGLDKVFNLEDDTSVREAEIDLFAESADIRLEMEKEVSEGICVLHCRGVMNHPMGSRYFKRQVLLNMESHKRILLDFEDLTFFDSLSVSGVLTMNKLLRQTGGALGIAGANYIVNDLFTTLNITEIMPFFGSVAEAIAQWK